MQDNTRGDPNNKKLNANSICVSRLNGQWSFESSSPRVLEMAFTQRGFVMPKATKTSNDMCQTLTLMPNRLPWKNPNGNRLVILLIPKIVISHFFHIVSIFFLKSGKAKNMKQALYVVFSFQLLCRALFVSVKGLDFLGWVPCMSEYSNVQFTSPCTVRDLALCSFIRLV